MVRTCVYPSCNNKMKSWTKFSFHRLPLRDPDTLKLWLVALKMDPNMKAKALRRLDYRVCSAHFSLDDYLPVKERKEGQKIQRMKLKRNAIPMASEEHIDKTELYDTQAVMDRTPCQTNSTDIQVNAPETCAATTEKPTLQHIVDEEAILQLMQNCPMCDRKCRCSKRTCGPYFVVYQSCYFCSYQRKWANQPEATIMNIHKANVPSRKKLQSKNSV